MNPEMMPNQANSEASWSDVADASADAERWEESEPYDDVERFPITDADKLQIAAELWGLSQRQTALDADLAAIKLSAKEKKSEIDGVLSEMKELHRALGGADVAVRGQFKTLSCFSLNTVRVVHIETGRVKERAMKDVERQLDLVTDKMLGALKPSGDAAAGDGTSIDDPSALLDAAKRGEATEPEDESLDGGDEDDLEGDDL